MSKYLHNYSDNDFLEIVEIIFSKKSKKEFKNKILKTNSFDLFLEMSEENNFIMVLEGGELKEGDIQRFVQKEIQKYKKKDISWVKYEKISSFDFNSFTRQINYLLEKLSTIDLSICFLPSDSEEIIFFICKNKEKDTIKHLLVDSNDYILSESDQKYTYQEMTELYKNEIRESWALEAKQKQEKQQNLYNKKKYVMYFFFILSLYLLLLVFEKN